MIKLFSKICIASTLLFSVSCNTKNDVKIDDKTTADSLALTQFYDLLKTVPQHGFMFGHQDATVYGIGWEGDTARSDVKSVCGDYPAVFGWEIGRIESGEPMSLDNISFEKIRQEIIDQHKRGGINTLSWHADNIVTGSDSWDISAGDSVVKSILPNGENHEKLIGWLNIVADFFNSLQTEDGIKVPILFRPWHEHTGSWFWWGKDHCTTEEYKQLWVFTHKYLEDKKMDNIIYGFSPGGDASEEVYIERYPGDEYVDLLGFDFYQRNGLEGSKEFEDGMNKILTYLTKIGKEHNKPIAVTEVGLEAVPIAKWWTESLLPVTEKYPLSYVLLWRNAREKKNHYYAPYPGQVSADDFVEFYNNPKTLFAKDVEKLYGPK